jgi:hypothetical protein
MMTALFCVGWGVVAVYFVLLVGIGAKPIPTPPLIESNSGLTQQMRTTKRLHTGSTLVLNPRRSNSF